MVPGVPVDLDDALVTRPYYRSTYVTLTRADRGLKFDSLYDPQLRGLRIGMHVVDNDYAPPGHLLAAEGLGGQIAGYSLFGAYEEANPAGKLLQAVVNRDVDVAIVWGPFAGYFAKNAPVRLAIEPVSPNRFRMISFTYSIGVAVRKGDTALQSDIQAVLDKECRKIGALVAEYGFPMSEESSKSCVTSPSAAAFSR
jgi:ABC-type amino acid transport substrate-binding protein